jgi:chloride channel protein, CIC family
MTNVELTNRRLSNPPREGSWRPEGEPRLLLESVFLGVIGALSAQVFTWMLRLSEGFFLGRLAGYRPPGSLESGGQISQFIGSHGLWLIPIVTTLGGVITGVLVYGFAPEAEGHGTDTVVNAFHRKEGVIRARVAPIKTIASAITIGSGGAAGREGPIALISAGVASLFATVTKRSEEERRLLLLAGMAAGLSAIFRTPMGTAVFSIEVLYGSMDFELQAFLYTMVSSAVAYTVNGAFVGFAPLFRVPAIATPTVWQYGFYAGLGVAGGIVGTLLPVVFYRTRDFFHRLPVPNWTKPAIGAFGVGLIALKLPQVLGGGYGWMQAAIDGQMALRLLMVLVFAKLIAFALTVASGGSGGVFAPSLYVGAMLGGSFAIIFHEPAAVFVIVGMAAVFGAAARVPIATMLMVTEMAGGYHLLVPAGMAVMIAYLLQVRLSSSLTYHSLYEGQVSTRDDSPAHYLEHIQVALQLLGRRPLPMADELGHLDLIRLLRSRIHFDLPGGRELTMGVLRENSSLAGKSIRTMYQELADYDFEIVSILRREHVILPHPETILQPEDRLVLLTTPPSRPVLAEHLEPLPPEVDETDGPSPKAV